MRFDKKIAYLPEQRPDIVTPEWLDWIVSLGYTGIYLEFDPFAPVRSGNVSQFLTLYRLISLYDLAWGDQRQRLREWIARVIELCHARGLKVYLALWEPRIPSEAWGLFPVEWHGRGGWDRKPWNTISWCMSHPPAAAAFERMATEAFASVPGIDGLKMGTHDNDAHLCSSEDCPRCKGLGDAEKVSRVFASLLRAVDASGLHRPDFDYVVYAWWMADDALAATAELMRGRRVTVLGRSTQGLPQMWKGRELGRVFDLALGLRGMSERFVLQCEDARRRGWSAVDMPAFGHTIEYFFQPYTPAPHRVAERLVGLRRAGAAGWFDYDCGGVYPGINTEIIRADHHQPADDAAELVSRTLEALYPPNEIDAARAAYETGETALAARPIALDPPDVRIMSGRCLLEHIIALPFDPADCTGMDQGHRVNFSAPSNFLTPTTVPILLEMYAEAAAQWAKAERLIARLKGQGEWSAILPWEKNVFRTHALCAASGSRYVRMAANRLARGRGEMSASAERDALVALFAEELADVETFAPMWRQDRRLLMNPNIRLGSILQACFPWTTIDRDDPFVTKIAHTREFLSRLKSGAPLDAVPMDLRHI